MLDALNRNTIAFLPSIQIQFKYKRYKTVALFIQVDIDFIGPVTRSIIVWISSLLHLYRAFIKKYNTSEDLQLRTPKCVKLGIHQ